VDIITYRGTCGYLPSTCKPTVSECVIIGRPDILEPIAGCEPFCPSGTCKLGWFRKQTSCWEGEYVREGIDQVSDFGCRNVDPFSKEGDRFEIQDKDGDTLYCDSVTSINTGDPWCPLGYQYENGFCQQLTAVCDQGFEGNLMFGCDDLYTPDDDEYYNEYQAECVGRSAYAPSKLDVYDQTCCYASVFNGYELYEWDREDTHIKIY